MSVVDASAAAHRSFDVICAGASSLAVGVDGKTRVGGGAARTSLALARHDLHSALATAIVDDASGRAITESIANAGVDVSAVALGAAANGLFFVRGGALQTLGEALEEPAITIPAGWSAPVLLLSGMAPSIAHAGALCQAARAARRVGTRVVVDLHADWSAWKGRNWRSIRMLVREADVVWASSEDLVGLTLDEAGLREAARPNAIVVVHRGGRVAANGVFGVVTHPSKLGPVEADDDFVAAIAFELVHGSGEASNDGAFWLRALARGHAAVMRTRR